MKKVTTLLVFCFLSMAAHAEYFFMDNRDVGWYFYEDEQVKVKKPPRKKPVLMPAENVTADNAEQVLESLQKSLKRTQSLAILNPTDENMTNYLQVQRRIFNISHQFNQAWQRQLLLHPELDSRGEHPLSSAARTIYSDVEVKKREKTLKAIASRVGLVFFYDVNCAYCQKFSPLLKQFTERVGFSVLPVSSSAEILPDWPGSRQNNGLATTFGITHLPHILVLDKQHQSVLGHIAGFRSEDELAARLLLLVDDGAVS